MLEMAVLGGSSHLDEGHGAVGVAEGLYHGLGGHQVGDAVRGRGLRGLLVLEGVEQVLTPVLLVAVLHDGPQGLGPGHLPAAGNRVSPETGDNQPTRVLGTSTALAFARLSLLGFIGCFARIRE